MVGRIYQLSHRHSGNADSRHRFWWAVAIENLHVDYTDNHELFKMVKGDSIDWPGVG